MARPKVQCSGYITICPACGVQHQEGCDVTTCPSCGAELIRCTRSAVYQFHYCHQHGGPRPTMGIFGKEPMSRFPIVKLSEKYDRMQKSGRLLSNRAAIEVVRTRIQQLAERIDMNHAPDRLATLGKLWADYRSAQNRGSGTEMAISAKQLDEQFAAAATDYAAWSQMFEAIDLDSKLVEREIKTIRELRAILTAEDARELVAKFLAVILRVFHDQPKKLKEVQFQVVKIIGDSPIDIPLNGERVVDVELDDEEEEV